MKDHKTISLGKGLGDLMFGASREEVSKYLGEPEDIAEADDTGYLSVSWHYWGKGISFYFEEEDEFRLGDIEITNTETLLCGEKLIGKNPIEVMAFADKQSFGRHTTETFEMEGVETTTLVSYDSKSLMFWFEKGQLTGIQWGYFIDAFDEPLWPDKSGE